MLRIGGEKVCEKVGNWPFGLFGYVETCSVWRVCVRDLRNLKSEKVEKIYRVLIKENPQ